MTDLARRDTALRLNPDVIAKRLDQATVLVNMSTNRIFELNETVAGCGSCSAKGSTPIASCVTWSMSSMSTTHERPTK